MKQVTLYTHETCSFCQKTKEYLKQHAIEFSDYDVVEDAEKAREMIKISGQMAVPVMVVRDGDNEEVVVGYDPEAFDKVLSQ